MTPSPQTGQDVSAAISLTLSRRCAGIALVGAVALHASAAFAGVPAGPTLVAETKAASADGDGAYEFAGFAASGLMVKKIYVEGLLPGDAVTSVFGDATTPATIRTSAAKFFNRSHGSANGQPDAADFELNPQLQWDTWLAVDNAPLFFVVPFDLNIGLASGGASIVNNDNMAWIASPPGLGAVTMTGRVLIGQFAFVEGSDFDIMVSVNVMRGGMPTAFRDLSYSFKAPDPVGACCVNGSCVEVTEADCALLGLAAPSVFHGVGTPCGSVDCTGGPIDLPGACCIEGECAEMTQELCSLSGGVFSGSGTTCDSVKCRSEPPVLTGACCVDGKCVEVTEEICALMGMVTSSVFHGVGSECATVDCNETPPDPDGACCVAGQCSQVNETVCTLAGGVFSGAGSKCVNVTCKIDPPPPVLGACCVQNECSQMTQALCGLAGGTFSGNGSSCEQAECGPPPADAVGACCVVCESVQVTAAMCEEQHGEFSGPNTECSRSGCRRSNPDGSGCRARYWEHRERRMPPQTPDFSFWPEPYTPADRLSEVFTIPQCITDLDVRDATLLEALGFHRGGGVNGAASALLREAVAALLNAQVTLNGDCNVEYPIANPAVVVEMVNQALATCDRRQMLQLGEIFQTFNRLDCPCDRGRR